MKILEFKIEKQKILKELARLTAYTGLKNNPGKDGDFFDRVATVEEDNGLIDGFWREACGELAEKLRDFIEIFSDTASGLDISLAVSGFYDDAQTPSLLSSLESFFVSRILGRWFAVTFSEKAEEQEEKSRRQMTGIIKTLCHRRAPVRKS